MSDSSVLVVAPHPDDEILGAGGTIAKYAADGREVTVLTVSGHLPPIYPPEAIPVLSRKWRRLISWLE